jgi:hypothetical protein
VITHRALAKLSAATLFSAREVTRTSSCAGREGRELSHDSLEPAAKGPKKKVNKYFSNGKWDSIWQSGCSGESRERNLDVASHMHKQHISFLHFILFLLLDSMGFVDHQRPFFNYLFGVQIQQLPVRYLLELLSFYFFCFSSSSSVFLMEVTKLLNKGKC